MYNLKQTIRNNIPRTACEYFTSWKKSNYESKHSMSMTLTFVIRVMITTVIFSPLSACIAESKYQKLPILKPFELHKANAKCEVFFKVAEENDYAYILQFHKNIENSREVLELMRHSVKGKKDTDGEPIYLSLEVYKVDQGIEYLDTQYGTQSLPLYSSGATFNKLIYRGSLLPGNYRAVVTSNKDIPKFKNIQVEFLVSFAHRPK